MRQKKGNKMKEIGEITTAPEISGHKAMVSSLVCGKMKKDSFHVPLSQVNYITWDM